MRMRVNSWDFPLSSGLASVNQINHLLPMFPIDPPENIRKLFLIFTGGSKGNIGKKRVIVSEQINAMYKNTFIAKHP